MEYNLEPAPCYYCSTAEGEPELYPNKGDTTFYNPNQPFCTFTNPHYRSPMKTRQHGTKIFNKMSSFEGSIGMLPLISIISSKESLL